MGHLSITTQPTEKKIDIFIGVYPSDEQTAYAKECGTTFEYTPIGSEAFVFFVHKDNPIDNLTTEQTQSIYVGGITNCNQAGGKNEKQPTKETMAAAVKVC